MTKRQIQLRLAKLYREAKTMDDFNNHPEVKPLQDAFKAILATENPEFKYPLDRARWNLSRGQ